MTAMMMLHRASNCSKSDEMVQNRVLYGGGSEIKAHSPTLSPSFLPAASYQDYNDQHYTSLSTWLPERLCHETVIGIQLGERL